MKKIHFTAIILLLLGLLLGAGCEGDYEIDYRFTGLDAQHAENTGSLPQLTNSDTISANAYVLRLYLFPEELSRVGRYLDPETPPYNVKPVTRMVITSNRDFDAAHPAGTQLSDLFEIYYGTYFATKSADNLDFSNVESPYFYDHPEPEFVDLLLIGAPSLSKEHRLMIQILLSDSTLFTDTTTSIYLR